MNFRSQSIKRLIMHLAAQTWYWNYSLHFIIVYVCSGHFIIFCNIFLLLITSSGASVGYFCWHTKESHRQKKLALRSYSWRLWFQCPLANQINLSTTGECFKGNVEVCLQVKCIESIWLRTLRLKRLMIELKMLYHPIIFNSKSFYLSKIKSFYEPSLLLLEMSE